MKIKVRNSTLRLAWHHRGTDLEGIEGQIRVWAVEVKEEGQLRARHGLELEDQRRVSGGWKDAFKGSPYHPLRSCKC